jgi:hypothetical protein
MANGIYYVDTLLPNIVADQGAITPTTTHKACWATGSNGPTLLPANFWYPGKLVRLSAYLKLTTGTAGNSAFAMALGTGDNPAVLVATATRAKVASVGPFGVYMQGYARCRAIGASATVSMWGCVTPDLGAFLSTTGEWVFPSNGTTVVSTFDSSLATLSLTFQYLTSAGTDSVVATDIVLESMN